MSDHSARVCDDYLVATIVFFTSHIYSTVLFSFDLVPALRQQRASQQVPQRRGCGSLQRAGIVYTGGGKF